MPESRGRKHKQKTQSQAPIPPPKQHRWLSAACTLLKRLGQTLAIGSRKSWQLIIVLSIVVGLVAGALFVFPPRLTVDSLGEFDASDPLSASFAIKNSWVLAMRDVRPLLGLCDFRITAQVRFAGNCNERADVRFVVPKWEPRYLDIDERFTIAMRDVFDTPAATFSGGDIVVGATFKPWWWPLHICRMFRFVAQKQSNGKFAWLPEASGGVGC